MQTVPRSCGILPPDSNMAQGFPKQQAKFAMRRQGISIPQENEVAAVLEAKQKIDTEMETHEALQGFSDFEQRNSRVNYPTPPKPQFDQSVITKYRQFEGTLIDGSTHFYAASQPVSPPLTNRCTAQHDPHSCHTIGCPACNPIPQKPSKKLVTKPWNFVDEPMKLTPKCFSCLDEKPANTNPWYSCFDKNNDCGIPYLSGADQRNHKQKVNKYNQTVRLQLTLDKKKQEAIVRKNVQSNLQHMHEVKEKTNKLYQRSGQGWCLDTLEKMKQKKVKPQKPKVLDPIDLEAIQEVAKKEQERIDAEKAKKAKPDAIEQ